MKRFQLPFCATPFTATRKRPPFKICFWISAGSKKLYPILSIEILSEHESCHNLLPTDCIAGEARKLIWYVVLLLRGSFFWRISLRLAQNKRRRNFVINCLKIHYLNQHSWVEWKYLRLMFLRPRKEFEIRSFRIKFTDLNNVRNFSFSFHNFLKFKRLEGFSVFESQKKKTRLSLLNSSSRDTKCRIDRKFTISSK